MASPSAVRRPRGIAGRLTLEGRSRKKSRTPAGSTGFYVDELATMTNSVQRIIQAAMVKLGPIKPELLGRALRVSISRFEWAMKCVKDRI